MKPYINNGINYQPQLVSLPDVRDPSTVGSPLDYKDPVLNHPGFNGISIGGLCFHCSYEFLTRLLVFMAGKGHGSHNRILHDHFYIFLYIFYHPY